MARASTGLAFDSTSGLHIMLCPPIIGSGLAYSAAASAPSADTSSTARVSVTAVVSAAPSTTTASSVAVLQAATKVTRAIAAKNFFIKKRIKLNKNKAHVWVSSSHKYKNLYLIKQLLFHQFVGKVVGVVHPGDRNHHPYSLRVIFFNNIESKCCPKEHKQKDVEAFFELSHKKRI